MDTEAFRIASGGLVPSYVAEHVTWPTGNRSGIEKRRSPSRTSVTASPSGAIGLSDSGLVPDLPFTFRPDDKPDNPDQSHDFKE
ncbi:hypothetical protein GA0115259_1010412 [Streptomyces sp. MnatMP-M17]|nr:hypothetical protein GA0115259_1010412 [Streptomyces sp. MnatMP-M17]